MVYLHDDETRVYPYCFDRQITIAIENYKKIWDTVGDKVDVVLLAAQISVVRIRNSAQSILSMNYGYLIISV